MDAPTDIAALEQARTHPVRVLHGSAHGTLLSHAGFTRINRNRSYAACLRMPMFGRVKLVVLADSDLAQKLNEAQFDPHHVRATPVVVKPAQGYTALSRGTSDMDVPHWSQALEHLRSSGQVVALASQFAR